MEEKYKKNFMEEKIMIKNEAELEKFLEKNGLKKGYKMEYVYVNKEGNVYSIKKNKAGIYNVKELNKSISNNNNFIKVNYRVNNKRSSVLLHSLIYNTFAEKKYKEDGKNLFFIDNNKKNCSFNNLISSSELIDYYRKNSTGKNFN